MKEFFAKLFSFIISNLKEFSNGAVMAIGTALTFAFGGWDNVIRALVWFIVLDYLTGVAAAIYNKKLSSNTGFKGLLKKGTILIVLVVGVLLDRLINNGAWLFRTLVAFYYIANEAISILENIGRMGVSYPEKLLNVLTQLKEKNNKGEEDINEQ